jgi:hypothetical protein
LCRNHVRWVSSPRSRTSNKEIKKDEGDKERSGKQRKIREIKKDIERTGRLRKKER